MKLKKIANNKGTKNHDDKNKVIVTLKNIVQTPTQPQPSITLVGLDPKMTLHTPTHHKLNVIKKYCQNPTATQLKATLKQLVLELDTVATWNPPTQPTTTNFSATFRSARELKFGTDTH